MRKRIVLTFAVGLMASVASLQAAACLSTTTVGALVALGASGCTVDDKLFNNFSYSASGGGPSASGLAAVLEVNVPTLTFGWDIGTPGSSFTGNFTFGFTVSEILDPVTCPGGFVCPITGTATQIFPAGAPVPSGNPMLTVTQSAGTPSPFTLNNASLAGNTMDTTISPGVTSLTVSAVSAGINNNFALLDASFRVSQSVIPEPVTMVLTGTGLLGLGLFRRVRRS
jgi:hypothetical protein